MYGQMEAKSAPCVLYNEKLSGLKNAIYIILCKNHSQRDFEKEIRWSSNLSDTKAGI
jgi:hypothetical protein